MSTGLPAESVSPSETNALSPAPAVWLEGLSPAITRVRAQILRVAPYFRMAALSGERGSGEEAAARILHQLSPLKGEAFFTLTPTIAEARMAATGSFESLATNGMIYIPQIECLSLAMQEALLRLIRKAGPHMPRIVAFAEMGLRPLVRAGSFSAGLANSLEALRVKVPSLRDRSEDIPALLSHIIENIARQSGAAPAQLTSDLLEAAMKLPWLGNLVELHSAAEYLMKYAARGPLDALDLEAAVLGPVLRETCTMRLEAVIRQHVRTVLTICNGDKQHAAQVLGISRSSLYRILKGESHIGRKLLHSTRLEVMDEPKVCGLS